MVDFRSLQGFVGHTVPFHRAEASQCGVMPVTGRVPIECRNLFHRQSFTSRRVGSGSAIPAGTHLVFFADFDDGLVEHVLHVLALSPHVHRVDRLLTYLQHLGGKTLRIIPTMPPVLERPNVRT